MNRNSDCAFRGRQRVVGESLSGAIGADGKLAEEKRSVAIRRQAAGDHAEDDRSIGQRCAIAGNGDDQRLCQARAGQAGLVAAGGDAQKGGGAVIVVEWIGASLKFLQVAQPIAIRVGIGSLPDGSKVLIFPFIGQSVLIIILNGG